MDAWHLMLVRELRDPLHDLSIGFSRRIVLAFHDLIGSDRSVLSDDQSRVNRPEARGL